MSIRCLSFFFFNDTATTEIYTLSLHDALPILANDIEHFFMCLFAICVCFSVKCLFLSFAHILIGLFILLLLDRKSTRLNSSHANISYAVFCLKKKKKSY